MIEEVILHFDGGIRKGLMAYGYIALDPKTKEELFCGYKTCGKNGTSNVAEYRALIAALKECLKKSVKKVYIIGDSQLIIKQICGSFKVNKKILKEHCEYVLNLLEKFDDYSIKWVPRKENKIADILVNKVFDKN